MGRSGAHVEYFVFMEKNYGRDAIDIFRQRKPLTLKMRIDDWIEQKLYWKERTAELLRHYNTNKYGSELYELLTLGKTLSDKS